METFIGQIASYIQNLESCKSGVFPMYDRLLTEYYSPISSRVDAIMKLGSDQAALEVMNVQKEFGVAGVYMTFFKLFKTPKIEMHYPFRFKVENFPVSREEYLREIDGKRVCSNEVTVGVADLSDVGVTFRKSATIRVDSNLVILERPRHENGFSSKEDRFECWGENWEENSVFEPEEFRRSLTFHLDTFLGSLSVSEKVHFRNPHVKCFSYLHVPIMFLELRVNTDLENPHVIRDVTRIVEWTKRI